MNPETNVQTALKTWQDSLSREQVLTDEAIIRRYRVNTIGIERQIPAVLQPLNTKQVVAVVQIAAKYKIPLYPISTGNNWGYGSANPVVDGCVVVDLSRMTAIDDTNIELGLVTVEPGVTQRLLRDYLDSKGHSFLVPVHGGGPNCSLLGNALERGYGITPYTDHFGAVTALEAVLPNGEKYLTPLTSLGASTVDKSFKWGVGPYMDGLFSQGGFGIVTRMTLALAPIPGRIETFFFGLARHEDLVEGVTAVRETLRSVGGVTGSVNLMNARRVLSMMDSYPADRVPPGGILPPEVVQSLAHQAHVMPWTGIGAIYGEPRLVKAARTVIRKKLKGVARRLIFVSPALVNRGRRLLERLPGQGGRHAWNYVSTLDKSLQLIAGAPSEVALPLAYWKSGTKPEPGSERGMNPAHDGCGLIWYSPLVPMIPGRVQDYVDMVERICTDHGIEPLITLTSLSDRCFDSTVPLLFKRNDPVEIKRAQDCYQALFQTGQGLGCAPYRASVQTMGLFTGIDSSYWRLVKRLKREIDPDNLISPGRYCPPD